MNEQNKPKRQYEELMQQTSIEYRTCEVCHHAYISSSLIAVEHIFHPRWRRVPPWVICQECAEKISNAFKASKSEGKNE